jgi:hypothetical protein
MPPDAPPMALSVVDVAITRHGDGALTSAPGLQTNLATACGRNLSNRQT